MKPTSETETRGGSCAQVSLFAVGDIVRCKNVPDLRYKVIRVIGSPPSMIELHSIPENVHVLGEVELYEIETANAQRSHPAANDHE